MVEVFRTSRWVWSCPEKNQLLVSSSSGNRMRRNRLLAGIAWGLRFGFGLDTQTVAGTTPGYAFFPSNSPTIERQEPNASRTTPGYAFFPPNSPTLERQEPCLDPLQQQLAEMEKRFNRLPKGTRELVDVTLGGKVVPVVRRAVAQGPEVG